MNSELPKVLHEVCGLPMLAHVLSACRLAGVDRMVVVVGHGKDEVIRRFEDEGDIIWVEQAEQKGTGNAVLCCRDALDGASGSMLIVAGDMPLVERATLAALIESREESDAAVSLATAVLDNPAGYGRIIRDAQGRLQAIVEDRECTHEQRELCEVNPSFYCFDGERLFEALARVEPTGSKAEYHLTEAVRVLREAGHDVLANVTVPPEDAMGVNSRLDLATANRTMQDRIQLRLMNEGVTIVDPDNTWIESDVSIGRETVVWPFTVIGTGAAIGEACRIGPFARVGVGELIKGGTTVGPTACSGVAAS